MTIQIRVQPRARRSALERTAEGALKAAVTAPPEDGKANRPSIALLARGVASSRNRPSRSCAATAREKTLSVAGEPEALVGRIAEWMDKHG